MAISESSALVRLPFTDRPPYGSPYPEGIAVGHIDVTGDVSGNPITALFLSDGGFLFRLELINVSRNEGTAARPTSVNISHDWATARSGRGANAFDINWILQQVTDSILGFSIYSLVPNDFAQIRRFPMGATRNVALQSVLSFTHDINTDGVAFDFDVVCSYWRAEALYRPGFLQAFYEAPVVSSPLPA